MIKNLVFNEQLLNIVDMTQKYKDFLVSQNLYFESIGREDLKEDCYRKTKQFYNELDNEVLSKNGLSKNINSFKTILNYKLTNEILHTNSDKLSKFIFCIRNSDIANKEYFEMTKKEFESITEDKITFESYAEQEDFIERISTTSLSLHSYFWDKDGFKYSILNRINTASNDLVIIKNIRPDLLPHHCYIIEAMKECKNIPKEVLRSYPESVVRNMLAEAKYESIYIDIYIENRYKIKNNA